MSELIQRCVAAVARLLSIVRVLGHTKRAVRAWLNHHYKILYGYFEAQPQVRSRAVFVNREYEQWFDLVEQALKDRAPLQIWIHGPGGCGKSTLAYSLARQAGGRHVLPVLVDAGVVDAFSVEDQVAAALGWSSSPGRPTLQMVRSLLSEGDIFLIVDGVDEQKGIKFAMGLPARIKKGEIKFICCTSRSSPSGDTSFTPVPVGPLTDCELDRFVRKYASGDHEEIAAELRQRWGTAGINPLFAVMAIGQRDETTSNDFELIDRYLTQQNRSGKDFAMAEADFLRACRLAAWACLEPAMWPRAVTTEFLIGMITAASSHAAFCDARGSELKPQNVVRSLIDAAVLFEKHEGLVVVVRFVHDPIAEHLGVAYLHVSAEKMLDRASFVLSGASEGFKLAWTRWKRGGPGKMHSSSSERDNGSSVSGRVAGEAP